MVSVLVLPEKTNNNMMSLHVSNWLTDNINQHDLLFVPVCVFIINVIHVIT
jgi:putative effector of murein hydrolase LrgA (UPF0299 family)